MHSIGIPTHIQIFGLIYVVGVLITKFLVSFELLKKMLPHSSTRFAYVFNVHTAREYYVENVQKGKYTSQY